MTYIIDNFATNLTRLRKERNLSQKELAEKLDISTQTISNIEKRKAYPTFANLDKIAEFFEATPAQLFGTSTQIELEISRSNINEFNKKAREIIEANELFNKFYDKIETNAFEITDGFFAETYQFINNLIYLNSTDPDAFEEETRIDYIMGNITELMRDNDTFYFVTSLAELEHLFVEKQLTTTDQHGQTHDLYWNFNHTSHTMDDAGPAVRVREIDKILGNKDNLERISKLAEDIRTIENYNKKEK